MSNCDWVINAFKSGIDEKEIRQSTYYKNLTLKERGRLVNYLNSVVYGYDENNPPRMDKTVFSSGSRDKRNIENLNP